MKAKIFSSPLQVGGIELKNRIIRTAHGTHLTGGGISEDFIAFHLERAKGGCALTILEAGSVHPTSVLDYTLFDENLAAGLQRLVDAVRPHGMKVFQQLWYGANLYRGVDEASPLTVSTRPGYSAVVGQPMTRADIQMLVAAYTDAALRCREGGLDGVEVHAAHGYVFTQFLSRAYNNRTDEYGGPLENRARFLLETLRSIRAAAGPGFVLGMRVSASEAPQFLSQEEVIEVVELVQAEGLIDYLNVSHGDYYRSDTMVGGMHRPMGYEIADAAAILAAARVPRIVAGRIRTLEEAESILREGVAELVSMVRALIADPYLITKTMQGRAEQVRPCIACNQGCGFNANRVKRIGCTVNPTAGFERTMTEPDLPTTSAPKKVLVVGGGPAGMEAARTAALIGHRVILAEAAPHLGGAVNVAKRAPYLHTLGDATSWLEQEVFRLGVEIRLGTPMDATDVRAESADAVIIATGSMPRLDGFQLANPGEPARGCDLPHVISSVDLLINAPAEIGKTALVLDTAGGHEAVGVAEFLVLRGVAVTFVTHLSSFAPDAWRRGSAALDRCLAADVEFTLLTRHHLAEIRPGSCLVHPLFVRKMKAAPADTVVLVTPNEPLRDIYDELRTVHASIVLVGDALAPRDLQYAIAQGHHAARALV